jgi:putative flippase GtrA
MTGGSRRRIAVRFTRFTAGSVVALATSELALVLCYGTGWLGTTAASAVAFFAGAIPNYVLNRQWVWGRRGRPKVRAELIPYVAISIAALVAGALATGLAARLAPGDVSIRVTVVAAAYVAATGLLFVVKFVVYERFVFAD